MGTISIRTKILLALALPLLTAVVLLGWGASRYLDTTDTDVRSFLLIGSGIMLGVTALATALAWRAISPIETLAQDARAVVDVRLPALLERMRSSENSEELRLARLEVNRKDEVGQLADAFNKVQEATVGVAVDQAALLRRGIGDLFVALAERNQHLIERQLAFIDELEADEEDPDQLEALFHLDHLATRAQRNAESLLVLAGRDPQRPTGESIGLHDVIRVAQGEVEGFSRVELGELVEAAIDRSVAVDIAHLLAELLENATMYSPQESTVSVSAETDGRAVAISIVDSGPGLSPERLRAANQLLSDPPLLGLTGASDLGWNLVSRLADRHEVHVELRPTATSGLQAIVALPSRLLLGAPQTAEDSPEAPVDLLFEADDDAAPPLEPALEPAAEALPEPPPVEPTVEPVAEALPTRELLPEPPLEPTVEPVAEALPTREPLPEPPPVEPTVEPVAALGDSSGIFADPDPFAPAPVHTPVPSPAPEVPFGTLGNEIPEEPPSANERIIATMADESGIDDPEPAPELPEPEVTAAGLVRRQRPVGGETAGDEESRTPEALREMLSRYRSSLDEGRAGNPDEAQETEE
ncbi:MAG: ATP-binding protein [Acidimicrobiales bacterium]